MRGLVAAPGRSRRRREPAAICGNRRRSNPHAECRQKRGAEFRRQDGEPAERGIDVEPQSLGAGECGDGGEVVDRAGVDRARRRRRPARARALPRGRRRSSRRARRATCGTIDRSAPGAAHRSPSPRSSNALAMAPCASREAYPTMRRGARRNARAPHIGAGLGVARDGEGDDGRHRGAGGEKAAGAFGKAEQLLAPLDHLALDIDRDMVAARRRCSS